MTKIEKEELSSLSDEQKRLIKEIGIFALQGNTQAVDLFLENPQTAKVSDKHAEELRNIANDPTIVRTEEDWLQKQKDLEAEGVHPLDPEHDMVAGAVIDFNLGRRSDKDRPTISDLIQRE